MAPLSRGITWAYASPSVSFGAMAVMFAVYLPSLYIDVIGVRMAQVGAVSTALQVSSCCFGAVFCLCKIFEACKGSHSAS